MKLVKIEYKRITGKWEIPPDMLRYDTAFMSDNRPGIVMFPTFKTKNGNLGGKITTGRWNSFLIGLLPVRDEIPIIDPKDNWYTYRHPKTGGGPLDYSGLEKVPMEKYLTAKDTNELN